MKRYLAVLAVGTSLFGGAAHAADKTHVNFIMDWAFEGAQAIWPAAAESGCFADNNLEAFREFCWHSWDEQRRSLARLLN